MRVRVVYGTQTGNSRSIAAQISDTLSEKGFDAECACLDQFKKVGRRACAPCASRRTRAPHARG